MNVEAAMRELLAGHVKRQLRFGCRTCDARFATIRERNDHEFTNEGCEPRTIPCIRCGEEAILDASDWAVCSECHTEWTA